MAHRLCCSRWALLCWLAASVARELSSLTCHAFSGSLVWNVETISLTLRHDVGTFAIVDTDFFHLAHFCSGLWAKGAEALAPAPGGAQHSGNPTDCQIFTLTPPPATRTQVTQPRPITRTPRQPLLFFPQRPRVPLRLPNRPFLPLDCGRSFPWQPWFWPRRCLDPRRCFLGTELLGGSSSEESRERRGLRFRTRKRPCFR